MGSGRVPGYIYILEGFPGTNVHRNEDHENMHTGMVAGHIWAQEWCRVHMGTGRVPGHIWAPERCPGTFGHQNGARINMVTGSRSIPGLNDPPGIVPSLDRMALLEPFHQD